MGSVKEGATGRAWGLSETHPYLLFLQRWWFTGQATARGYNVLSLDSDMHIAVNPILLVRSPPYARHAALLQLDSGWPVEGAREGQRATDERGQHENVLPCTAAAAAALACACGPTPMPLLNTGFVWARAAEGQGHVAQSLLFNRSVERILNRLTQPPRRNAKGEVDPHSVWAQDVVNEVASSMARLPAGAA